MRMKTKISPPKIEIRNLQRKIKVNIADLQRFARKAVAACLDLRADTRTELETLSELSVLIVSDMRMASLHRRFMNESGPTDVITFQHGEIFISAETALRHARKFGNALNRELRLYIIHGLLHLHGFDDHDDADARKMRAMEKRILDQA